MIKIEDVEVMGMRKALKGMRNSMNSWAKSDSYYLCKNDLKRYKLIEISSTLANDPAYELHIGEADMDLSKRLIKASSSESKHMRMIHVQADVTGPLYWWKQYDTYKVATTSNSTSTMHTIHSKEFTLDDFSHEHLLEEGDCAVYPYRGYDPYYGTWNSDYILELVIELLNKARELYLETKDKKYWWQMIQLLPSSYNQMRTIDLSYETLLKMYRERKNHKLNEWKEFCKWIETLPYMKEFLEI